MHKRADFPKSLLVSIYMDLPLGSPGRSRRADRKPDPQPEAAKITSSLSPCPPLLTLGLAVPLDSGTRGRRSYAGEVENQRALLLAPARVISIHHPGSKPGSGNQKPTQASAQRSGPHSIHQLLELAKARAARLGPFPGRAVRGGIAVQILRATREESAPARAREIYVHGREGTWSSRSCPAWTASPPPARSAVSGRRPESVSSLATEACNCSSKPDNSA